MSRADAPHTTNTERQREPASRDSRGLPECSEPTSLQTVKRVVHILIIRWVVESSSEIIRRESLVDIHFRISERGQVSPEPGLLPARMSGVPPGKCSAFETRGPTVRYSGPHP